MITVRREVRTRTPLEPVARYLSDFTTTEQWDPHTDYCDRVGDHGSEPVVGDQFVNVQKLLGRRTEFVYTVAEVEPLAVIALRGTSKNVDATDSMRFHPDGDGTRVVYEATFRFGGLLGRVEPLIAPVMNRIADDGAVGMQRAIDRL